MRRTRLFFSALAIGLMTWPTSAETDFTGHWAQANFNDSCSLVFGFLLKSGGSANVDWVESKWNAAKNKAEFSKGRREGRWTAKGGTLHLAVVEVEKDPKVLKLFDKTAPVTKTTNVDATLSADGKTLNATVKAQNIEHKIFTFKCVYNRDKR